MDIPELSIGSNKPLRRDGTWMQRWRVPLGFLAAFVFLLLARPGYRTLAIGGVVSILGLTIRAWASGHIRKNSALAISGPYAYSRNPLYLGSFFLGLGFTITSGRWELAILFVALFLGIYFPVMRVESATLFDIFGDRYRVYAREVPLLFPRLTAYSNDESKRITFDSRLYIRYREYRAAIGFLIVWVLMAFKAYYIA
jgi:protein-S-isoprenylcysteine O-methyltransferase Ste14